jgi:hypothetical protein
VLGRVPPDAALDVLARVEAAMALLDDPELTLHLHPDDHAVLADHRIPGVVVCADATVAAGEARITGAYAGAELTRTALLSAVVVAIREGDALDDVLGDASGDTAGDEPAAPGTATRGQDPTGGVA